MQDEGQASSLEAKKELTDSHRLIGYWAAHGWDAKEIAKELNYAEKTVKSILKTKEVQFFVKKVKHKIYGEDPALHIKECAKRGIDIADGIMMDKKNKPQVRQDVAFKFMDRAWGKPEAKVDLGEGTVRKLLSLIQNPSQTSQPSQNPIDTKDVTPKDIEDAQYSEISEEAPQDAPKETDSVDDWISKNIK